MTTTAPEAPAAPTGEAPPATAPPASSTTPDVPPAPPETQPPAAPAPPAPEPQLETVDDLGEGPDGDPVEGEDQLAKVKRIARREAKEKREAVTALTTERDQALARAEAAEQERTAAVEAAAKLPEVESELASAKLDLLRFEVAASKGLTVQQAPFLKGSTAEEIEASAAAYIAANAMPGRDVPKPQTEAERRAWLDRMNRNRT